MRDRTSTDPQAYPWYPASTASSMSASLRSLSEASVDVSWQPAHLQRPGSAAFFRGASFSHGTFCREWD